MHGANLLEECEAKAELVCSLFLRHVELLRNRLCGNLADESRVFLFRLSLMHLRRNSEIPGTPTSVILYVLTQTLPASVTVKVAGSMLRQNNREMMYLSYGQ